MEPEELSDEQVKALGEAFVKELLEEWQQDEEIGAAMSTDSEGHQHKGEGPGGGQFTGSGGGNASDKVAFTESLAKWAASLDKSEAAYISVLGTGVAYKEINTALRSGKVPQECKYIDSALDKAKPLEKSVTGYRGIKSSVKVTDGEHTDKGYAFVALTKEQALTYGNRVYEVTIPAGTKAGRQESKKSGFQEYIVPRNTTLQYKKHEHKSERPGGGQFTKTATDAAVAKVNSAEEVPPPPTDPEGKLGPYMSPGMDSSESDEDGKLTQSLRKVMSKGRSDVEEVSLASLVGTQSAVRKKSVVYMIGNPPDDKDHELPVVVKAGGKHYLYDGHHKVSAALHRGVDQLKVKVYR